MDMDFATASNDAHFNVVNGRALLFLQSADICDQGLDLVV